jgi:molybdopterin-binding protein
MTKQNQLSSISRLSIILSVIFIFSVRVFGTVEKLNIEEKTKKASLIVTGTVKSTQSQWEKVNEGRRIFTYVYIEVEKYIKGSGGKQIEIKVPGGKVGEITERASDTPQFTVGERVILFLKSDFFRVVGWHQGKYTVKDNKVVGLGVEVNEFIDMIQRIIDKESYSGAI